LLPTLFGWSASSRLPIPVETRLLTSRYMNGTRAPSGWPGTQLLHSYRRKSTDLWPTSY
jgi:hypothetical protein